MEEVQDLKLTRDEMALHILCAMIPTKLNGIDNAMPGHEEDYILSRCFESVTIADKLRYALKNQRVEVPYLNDDNKLKRLMALGLELRGEGLLDQEAREHEILVEWFRKQYM